jgi:NADH-quinone oxidoreductase subunit A
LLIRVSLLCRFFVASFSLVGVEQKATNHFLCSYLPTIRCARIFLTKQKMPSSYIPIVIFAILAAAFPVVCLAAFKLVWRESDATGLPPEPAEREISPDEVESERHWPQFYILGALFLIFDVAIVFLFPWAIKFSQMGGYGLVTMLIFTGIVMTGYAWLYKKGALD